MNNKTKVVRFRCSEAQLEWIKERCGDNMSNWIIQTLLSSEKETRKKGSEFIKREIEKMEEHVTLAPIHIPTIPGVVEMHCRSPNCQSIKTKLYHRATGDFYLCDTHKP